MSNEDRFKAFLDTLATTRCRDLVRWSGIRGAGRQEAGTQDPIPCRHTGVFLRKLYLWPWSQSRDQADLCETDRFL